VKVGDLVRTIKGNVALVSSIDEKVTDRFGEEQLNFVTLIYCDTGIENCYCDARYLTLLQRPEE
jgi:hypothetical protein